MESIRKFLLGNNISSKRDSYFWNLIASGINASEAIVVLMIATRTVGIEESGILTIAFTIANLMLCIGKFGMRNYQATDIKGEFFFEHYLYSRYISIILMEFFAFVLVFIMFLTNKYSLHKSFVIFIVVAIYAVEAWEDIYLSEFQRYNRLDIGVKMFSVRWFITLLLWGSSLVLLRDTTLSALIALISDWVICYFFIKLTQECVLKDTGEDYVFTLINKSEKSNRSVITLMCKCFPLFISSFLALYITNASKYSIDSCLTDDIQACYGFVAMPVFVIGLLNYVVYQPILVRITDEWESGQLKQFCKSIYRQVWLIIGISIVCIVGAWVWGIPILSILYITDLTDYKSILMIMLIGGMWLAFAGFFNAIITIMRKQKYLMIIYCCIAITAITLSNPIVRGYGVLGAAVSNMVWCFLESIIFGILIATSIRHRSLNEKRDIHQVG